jgi:hypothetical protein
MKKVHKIFDFVRLEDVPKSRHRSPATANLMLDPLFF